MGRGALAKIICNTCGAKAMRPASAVYKTNYCNNECKAKAPRPMKIPDIVGFTYGKLKVLSHLGVNERGKRYYLCQCKCGNAAEVEQYHLRKGKTRSCGCMKGKKASLEPYKSRWEELEAWALSLPKLKELMDNIAKEYPLYV